MKTNKNPNFWLYTSLVLYKAKHVLKPESPAVESFSFLKVTNTGPDFPEQKPRNTQPNGGNDPIKLFLEEIPPVVMAGGALGLATYRSGSDHRQR